MAPKQPLKVMASTQNHHQARAHISNAAIKALEKQGCTTAGMQALVDSQLNSHLPALTAVERKDKSGEASLYTGVDYSGTRLAMKVCVHSCTAEVHTSRMMNATL